MNPCSINEGKSIMKSRSKLKWNKARLLVYIGFAYLITLIAEDQAFGTHYATWIWGAVFIIWGVAQSLRTRLVYYAVFGVLCGLGAWHYELAVHAVTVLSIPTFALHLIVIVAMLLLWGMKVMNQQEQLETHARRIFEQAAGQVEDAADGFTGRPYVIGKAGYSKEEIQSFARFLDASRIVKARIEKDKTILMFSMTTSPLSRLPLEKVSHISFDPSGNIAVQISKADYRQYKEQLTFDQLCAALADLFKQFLKYFREGKENRILTELGGVN